LHQRAMNSIPIKRSKSPQILQTEARQTKETQLH
jgi:hypothetical protein